MAKRVSAAPRPVGVVLDTCVWLDLAANHTNEPLLAALEHLCRDEAVTLIVPDLVKAEFARNKQRVIKDSGRSLASSLKRARQALYAYGDPKKRNKAIEAVDDIEHRLSGSIEVAADAIKRIEKMFSAATPCATNQQAVWAASNRAIEKRAPFHNDKNAFADAILIELYGQLVLQPKGARYVFVTHNVKDFSTPNGDHRLPHPDIAPFFSRIKSKYFIKLVDALRTVRPQEFAEAMFETEFEWEPRKASEIHAAIDEMWDRVWHDRHMQLFWKVHDGKVKIVETYDPKRHNTTVTRDIWNGARNAAARIEKKYGKDNLGPYSKFDWGMINGKLSALRWVFGDEWDMLDT